MQARFRRRCSNASSGSGAGESKGAAHPAMSRPTGMSMLPLQARAKPAGPVRTGGPGAAVLGGLLGAPAPRVQPPPNSASSWMRGTRVPRELTVRRLRVVWMVSRGTAAGSR